MPATLNGRADLVGPPILIGDFFPEKREVVVNKQKYEGWVTTNKRYPRPIQGRLDRYRNIYQNAIEPVLSLTSEPQEMSDQDRAEWFAVRQSHVDVADEAYDTFLTDAIMALVDGLDQGTVEMMDRESIETVLRELGYFTAAEDSGGSGGSGGTVVSGGDSEESAPLTGAISTPDSVGSTQPIPSNDS